MPPTQLYTIGFTRKSAQEFFSKLSNAGVRRVVDIRLNNTSQLAGFAKRDDLIYFLKEIAQIDYTHQPQFAPTQELLDAYKKQKGAWEAFEKSFLALMKERRTEDSVERDTIHQGCLLCSEDTPEHCHRRLVAEYLQQAWGQVEITHLV